MGTITTVAMHDAELTMTPNRTNQLKDLYIQ